MGAGRDCDTELGLGFGSRLIGHTDGAPPAVRLDLLHDQEAVKNIDVNKLPSSSWCSNDNMTAASPNSAISSFHVDSRVKREFCEVEKGASSSRPSDDEEDGGGTRKKLRLSKQQSAVLEESFKDNTTLNPKMKQVLAKQLNLRPRQVEVWFQNRRARTKLKQTEMDYEFLKRYCETMRDDNIRMQKELQELRVLKMAAAATATATSTSPLYLQMPAATLTLCPSCERLVAADHTRSFNPLPKFHFYSTT